MKIQCKNPECKVMVGLESDYKVYRGYVFCSTDCTQVWRTQERRFQQAAHPQEGGQPLNYKKRKLE